LPRRAAARSGGLSSSTGGASSDSDDYRPVVRRSAYEGTSRRDDRSQYYESSPFPLPSVGIMGANAAAVISDKLIGKLFATNTTLPHQHYTTTPTPHYHTNTTLPHQHHTTTPTPHYHTNTTAQQHSTH
jgi:hypothetical protein